MTGEVSRRQSEQKDRFYAILVDKVNQALHMSLQKFLWNRCSLLKVR